MAGCGGAGRAGTKAGQAGTKAGRAVGKESVCIKTIDLEKEKNVYIVFQSLSAKNIALTVINFGDFALPRYSQQILRRIPR